MPAKHLLQPTVKTESSTVFSTVFHCQAKLILAKIQLHPLDFIVFLRCIICPANSVNQKMRLANSFTSPLHYADRFSLREPNRIFARALIKNMARPKR
jgi:hypothetical protein